MKGKLYEISLELDTVLDLLTEEEPIGVVIDEDTAELIGTRADTVNWSHADDRREKEGIYFSELKDLTELKGLTIIGEVTSTFDLKSYVGKDGKAGLIYRFVLTDNTGGVTCITFDDMAEKCKAYPIGTVLKITNAWKMKENKNKIRELHLGNFAKIEVVE